MANDKQLINNIWRIASAHLHRKNGQINQESEFGLLKMKKTKSKWPMWIGLALLIAIAAVGYSELRSGWITKMLTGLFGPPKVTLQETFSVNPDGPSFDHSAFNTILLESVDGDGWVDYATIKTNVSKLDAYIDSVGKANFGPMGRNEKLAFLINAYNAFTLKLIVEKYPLDSIKEIPDAKRWDAVRWNLAGETVSLNQIEHERVRPNFKEPRIHFALVCAAIGCPPLRNEAYRGKDIENQLAEQASYVHGHKTWFSYEQGSNQLKLTQLYNWYGDDFVQVAGSVESFASNYSPELSADLKRDEKLQIGWLEYDWKLNDTSKKISR